MTFSQWLLALAMIFTCFLLVVVILLQRGRGGGLAGAFGGAGGTSAFGAKTGDVFTWITVVVASVFILLSIAATFVFDQTPRANTATVAAADESAAGTAVPADAIKIDPNAINIDPNLLKVDAPPGVEIKQVPNPFITQPVAKPADSAAPTPAGEAPKPADSATPPPAEKPADQPKQPESPPKENPNP